MIHIASAILPRCARHRWQGFFHTMRRRIQKANDVIHDQSGAIYVEYITLVVLVTLVGALLVVGIGVPLVKQYEVSRMILLAPIP